MVVLPEDHPSGLGRSVTTMGSLIPSKGSTCVCVCVRLRSEVHGDCMAGKEKSGL